MGAFSNIPGISDMQARMLEDAVRYQDMVEQAQRLWGGWEAIDFMHSNGAAFEMLEGLRRPELDLVHEMRDLESGVTAQREAMEAALGFSYRHMLRYGDTAKAAWESASAGHQLQAAAERMATEGPWSEDLRRATEDDQTLAKRIASDAERFVTMSAFVREHTGYEGTFAAAMKDHSTSGVTEAVKAALAIEAPWINRTDPLGSIAGYVALSEIGKAMAGLNTDYFASAEHLRSLMGQWTPPAGFALWDEVKRFEAFAKSGIDPSILEIPALAFPQVAEASGIVVPVPSLEPKGQATTKDPKVAVPIKSSIAVDAHEHVQCVELLIRQRLSWVMATAHGPNWPKLVIHGTVLRELKERQAKKSQVGKSEAILDYSTFGELLAIAMRKDVFAAAFGDLLMGAEEFRVCVERLIEVRNAVDHGRPLDPTEFLWAFTESTRLQRAFGVPCTPAQLES